MNKQYTKKQITEALAYWKGVLKKMNESGIPHYIDVGLYDDDDMKTLDAFKKRNPYRVSFNYYFDGYDTYGGGLIGATSKNALKQCIKRVAEDIILTTEGEEVKCSKPYVYSNNLGPSYRGVARKIKQLPAVNDMFDLDAIVNNIDPTKCVAFHLDTVLEDGDYIIEFTADSDDCVYDDYWFEDTTI